MRKSRCAQLQKKYVRCTIVKLYLGLYLLLPEALYHFVSLVP